MSFSISASGMTAQRIRMDVIANNIANANTMVTAEGTPYRRREVILEAPGRTFAESMSTARRRLNRVIGSGVTVQKIVEDRSPMAFTQVYDPGHPFADGNGMVLRPNVNVTVEMVNMIDASRAYEANITAFNSYKQMAQKALQIGSQR
ncbi:MAG TPA: flagellar basal body rod protein FlgC [bacterium]|nr:flagellar basal body rod protein FlgC [Candidatus Omnitrophota bacterium]HOJ58910.1 flagellar basal body rod protein FlgC [bacterium]HOL93556.1 flagellar basal body rod protein FlgC [bacterium]HPP00485.1 flagellar basal body rod protein FlgC [bacterium]HXK95200.1 flagellar basal body rod protein FlgC [bacterium]